MDEVLKTHEVIQWVFLALTLIIFSIFIFSIFVNIGFTFVDFLEAHQIIR
jgi:hypothetical protein